MATAKERSLIIDLPNRNEIKDLIKRDKEGTFLILGIPSMGHVLIIAIEDGEPPHPHFMNVGLVIGIQQDKDNERLYMVHTDALGENPIRVELHFGVS